MTHVMQRLATVLASNPLLSEFVEMFTCSANTRVDSTVHVAVIPPPHVVPIHYLYGQLSGSFQTVPGFQHKSDSAGKLAICVYMHVNLKFRALGEIVRLK